MYKLVDFEVVLSVFVYHRIETLVLKLLHAQLFNIYIRHSETEIVFDLSGIKVYFSGKNGEFQAQQCFIAR